MATKGSYKELLLRAKEMMGQAGLVAYDRAKVLVEVFNDRQFRADNGNADDWACARMLDSYCGDLALRFLDLKRLIEHFTEREQWADGNIRKMNAKMLTAAEKQADNSASGRLRDSGSAKGMKETGTKGSDVSTSPATNQNKVQPEQSVQQGDEASSACDEQASRFPQDDCEHAVGSDDQMTLGGAIAENRKLSASERVDAAIESFLNLSKSERREFLARYEFQDAISRLNNAPVVLRADMLGRRAKPALV